MTQVFTQADLQAALTAMETDIQVAANFSINAIQNIEYATTISSAAGGPYTLTKDESYSNFMFGIRAGGSLTLTNIIIDGAKDTHPDFGGGMIWMTGGALILDNGSILQNNRAGHGGAVVHNEVNPINIIVRGNAIIRNNEAAGDGGGIYGFFSPGGSIQVSDQARIENNKAGSNGGGIYGAVYDSTTILTVSGNAVITNNTANNGGGFFMYQCDSQVTDNAEISNNQANANGGGIYCERCRLQVDDNAKIQDNLANSQGGGIYLTSLLSEDIAIHGLISGNAAESGGGMFLSAPSSGTTVDLSRARFVENKSVNGSGGGMNLTGDSSSSETLGIISNNTVFRSNQATADGAAFSVNYTGSMPLDLRAADSQFYDNTALNGRGGVFLSQYGQGTAQFQNCTFTGNKSQKGGALYLTLETDGQMNLQLTDDVFTMNEAQLLGGAIALGEGNMDVTLNHVTVSGNTSGTGGGGLSSENSSGRILIENNSQFTSNHGPTGGAIYHEGEITLAVTGAVFSQNTSASNGQGIYNDGPLELSEAVASENGLYFESLATAPNIMKHLTDGSIVQLEPSSYVTPNPDGTPIVVAQSSLTLTMADANAFHPPAAGFNGWDAQVSENSHEIVLAPVEHSIRYENTMGAENPNPTVYTVLTPTITLLNLASTSSCIFIGWFDAPEGGIQVTNIPLGSTGDKTLYARWQAVEYTITYNGNDDGGTPAKNVPLPQKVQSGGTVELSASIPTRLGYQFSNWNSSPDGAGLIYQPGQFVGPVYEDFTIYAQWIPLPPPEPHTLTYCGNDTGGPRACCVPCPQRIPHGENARLSCSLPCRGCYRFISWNTSPCGTGQTYCPGQVIGPVTEDIYIYAQWKCLPPLPPCCMSGGE